MNIAKALEILEPQMEKCVSSAYFFLREMIKAKALEDIEKKIANLHDTEDAKNDFLYRKGINDSRRIINKELSNYNKDEDKQLLAKLKKETKEFFKLEELEKEGEQE